MFHSSVADEAVTYQLDPGPAAAGEPLGSTARGGLASVLRVGSRAGVERALAEAVRLPVPERRSGFTIVQTSLVLLAALAAGGRSARANSSAACAACRLACSAPPKGA